MYFFQALTYIHKQCYFYSLLQNGIENDYIVFKLQQFQKSYRKLSLSMHKYVDGYCTVTIMLVQNLVRKKEIWNKKSYLVYNGDIINQLEYIWIDFILNVRYSRGLFTVSFIGHFKSVKICMLSKLITLGIGVGNGEGDVLLGREFLL